ncbi:mitogen-activated protein kinase kinase kinase 20-like isoform X1 [Acanthaster planci]|uniref:Mitogen-activated protein kinase kinase kinase 20-like isoform X1 n=1 Tax=Acanthaster planci TaxID=133434 RepID=A0A8B7YYL2_ACAPL|nr:mitogen-activated protein kinase kinase kinase 20-like isoform X1 [Acanthaster planci]XP_022098429.1 mitogen-activated protein kinase kinase kinase 20-like isoform X1 [Acanthaster planci]XP_022098430.1 mitogen-activated protein kinase kinase kinase 20-like isoform X1 [Acanthaster planci]XP_022098431.1 mitogen-activated protein kinase kinase kinase 20-like isoform X1 [Acanthaster planci]XP_022098432.1 mitogen-activated protein kinase kinase kinase 20-like isoform X1 [Acanthaster planci]
MASTADPHELVSLIANLKISGVVIIDDKQFDWENSSYLGQGTHGTVCCVTWNQPGHDAVKVAAKKTNRVESVNEIKVLMQLEHPNIISCYGVVITAPTLSIIMEFAPNGSLDNYLSKHAEEPLSTDKFFQWCMNLALAVQYMHDQDLVHRDIKAPNCLISQDWELKLCDFYDARELPRTTSTEERGSWPWMAPEVMSERKYSKKSDIYSLTMVFWQLLTRQEPFHHLQNRVQVVWAVCQHERRPIIPQDCPDVLAAILTDGWEQRRDRRPEISQILERLSQMRAALLVTSPQVPLVQS